MTQAPIFLTEADVSDLLDFDGALDVLERAFRATVTGEATNRSRTRIPLGTAGYNLMSAGLQGEGFVGLKVYTVSAHGAPMHILLHAADGTGLLAVMQGGRVSGLRTGAVSGLSARYLAPKSPGPLAVIGSGFQAAAQVRGLLAATGASEVRVFSRDADKRSAFAKTMGEEFGEVTFSPVGSAAEACDGARTVVTITNSPTPVLMADDVQPGTHVIGAGNNTWMNAEIDPALFAKATTVVVDDLDQARIECGELMRAADRGLISWNEVSTLGEVIAGMAPGRVSEDDIPIFEWQGVAIADVAIAGDLYRSAVAKGRGLALA
ncbi:alanine dehydrogenase [soil metagenome]